MKVLFCINNDDISTAIAEHYEKAYGEKLEYKNLYYFKAIFDELKMGQKYDRIVLHEELEPFATKNLAEIDKTLFDNIDKVSDEGKGIDIVYICSERRKRNDDFIKKLFNIGIYGALIGDDRTIEIVCSLIKNPRSKKDAKNYMEYDVNAQVYNTDSQVKQDELESILAYYEKLGNEEEKYSEVFERISEQYTAEQLRVIVSVLPDHVIDVLSRKCKKYKQIMTAQQSNNVSQAVSYDPNIHGPIAKPEQPASQPQKITEQVTEQVTERVTKQVEEPIVEQHVEAPVAKPVANPVAPPQQAQQQTKPVAQPQQVPQQIKQVAQAPLIKQTPPPQKIQPQQQIYTQNTAKPSASTLITTKIQKVTKVIEKEVIREVYETPKDYRKVVCLVGAHKAGVTFSINAIAANLASKGIKTALLDMTRNKDLYFLYTENDEELRDIAADSLVGLTRGQDNPLRVGNVSIYTGIPGDLKKEIDPFKTIEAAKSKNSVILIDCDYATSLDVYKMAQSIFIVQDMDILNIQPITTFMRELKYRGVPLEKVQVIINKYVKCGLPIKRMIEGLSFYRNAERTIFDELLPKGIAYYVLPFNEINYKKYVEGIYASKVSYPTFTEEFKQSVDVVVSNIYPIGMSRINKNSFEVIINLIKSLIPKKKKQQEEVTIERITM